MRSLLRSVAIGALGFTLVARAEPPLPQILRPDQAQDLARGTLRLDGFRDSEGQRTALLDDSSDTWVASVAVPDCTQLYRSVRAAGEPISIGSVDYPVEIAYGLVSSRGRPLVDLSAAYCEMTRAESPSRLHRIYELLSLVGPVVSFRVFASDAMAGGRPYSSEAWEARDVRTSALADVREFVEPSSLAEALRRNAVVRGLYGGRVPDVATNTEILSRLDGPSAFAWYTYDPGRDQVALRLAFHDPLDSCGICLNAVSQVGVWVQPTPAFRRYLVEASAGQGFTMRSDFGHRALD